MNRKIILQTAFLLGGVLLSVSSARSDDRFKPSANCPELRHLLSELEDQFNAYRASIEQTATVGGETLAILARQQKTIVAKAVSEDEASETTVGRKVTTRIANQQGKGRFNLKFGAKETGAELATEETAAETLSLGAELGAFGLRLLKNGAIIAAADITLKLFTGATLPLETQLNDNPVLFLVPEKILGGTTSICTAYHFEPERMKSAENKL